MASAFPTRGHDIGHSIWVHYRACWLNNFSPRSCDYNTVWASNVKRRRHANTSPQPLGVDMNVTLVTAIALLVLWGVLVFAMHLGSGPVQLSYAASAILFARRMITGAPKFLS